VRASVSTDGVRVRRGRQFPRRRAAGWSPILRAA
jgi:hypothetical protein